jgi:hypothetical protein
VKLPEVESHRRRVVTPDELVLLGEALGPEYAPMAYLGTVIGLRRDECAEPSRRPAEFSFWHDRRR